LAEDTVRKFSPLQTIENVFRTNSRQRQAHSAVLGAILGNLELCWPYLPATTKPGFIALKNRQRLKTVVERAKELLVDEGRFQDRPMHLSLLNGVLQIDTGKFYPSTPSLPVRETLPVGYDPDAKCEMFLQMFLAHILEPADIDLLQRYLSQILEGINHSQTILVLTGDSGWGKSSLMKILGDLLGWQRVGIIRDRIFKDELELSHYAKKHFLFHPDMPTEFLDCKEASMFKQLVGADPLWADVKGDGRMVLEGHFPVILACNGKPKIRFEEGLVWVGG
jgi:phage/plasmid-associated DNA primase